MGTGTPDRHHARAPTQTPSNSQTQPAPIIVTPPINAPQPSHIHTSSSHPSAPHSTSIQHNDPSAPRLSQDEHRARFADDIPSPVHFIRSPTPLNPGPAHSLPPLRSQPPVWGPSTIVMGGRRSPSPPRRPPSPVHNHVGKPRVPLQNPPYVYVSSPRSLSSASSRTSSIAIPHPAPAAPPSYYSRFNPYQRKPKKDNLPAYGIPQWHLGGNRRPTKTNTLPSAISEMIDSIHALLLFDLPLLYYGRFKQVIDRAQHYIEALASAECPYSAEDVKYQDELMDSLIDAWQGSVMCFAAVKNSEAVLEFIVDISKRRSFLWNVWVLISLPIIWLSWAMIGMFVALVIFVWFTGTSSDNPNPIGIIANRALPPRIVITVLFFLGIVSFCSSAITGRHLRHTMEEKKKDTIKKLIGDYIHHEMGVNPGGSSKIAQHFNCAVEQYIGRPQESDGRDTMAAMQNIQPPRYQSQDESNQQPSQRFPSLHRPTPYSRRPSRQYSMTPRPSYRPPFPLPLPPKISVVKLIPLPAGQPRHGKDLIVPSELDLQASYLNRERWDELRKEIEGVWNTEALNPVFKVLKRWNQRHFNEYGGQIVLAQETGSGSDEPEYGIYFISTLGRLPHDPSRFTKLPPHELAILLPPHDFV
ncbi:hypothetical protein CVT24_009191 [Panaeolus cyanescens]|uniref:Uncharacterized protein n=1 Tax=Panaeolus cyanescens TaxID=181874 RepID=A0A409Y8X3_9AGAR|nr:hypothetical protein CVT24_009191 [Panaeolus cyanescens]